MTDTARITSTEITIEAPAGPLVATVWDTPSTPHAPTTTAAERETIVLVHGMKDTGHAWRRVAEALAPTYRVIAPDLRGHGASPWSADRLYAMSGFVADLNALVTAVSAKPVMLVAHSLGGNIALRFAAARSDIVHALVVVEGIGPSPSKAGEEEKSSAAERQRDWLARHACLAHTAPRPVSDASAAADILQKANPALDRPLALTMAHRATRVIDVAHGTTRVWAHDPALGAIIPEDYSHTRKMEMFGEITCPVLLVYGGASWASNPADDGRLAHFRDADLVVMPSAGHWPHHDDAPAFTACVRRFLERTSA
ncbi:MAG: alpha/beta hydrolase [Pseudomonadota bacterium]